eukprot:scaffold15798_cov40-Cyclotella_meneghiniana.AAC.1
MFRLLKFKEPTTSYSILLSLFPEGHLSVDGMEAKSVYYLTSPPYHQGRSTCGATASFCWHRGIYYIHKLKIPIASDL